MLNETQSQQIFCLMYRHGLTNYIDTNAKACEVLGLRQMNTCRKIPLPVKFLDDDILHCLLWLLSFYVYRKHKEILIQRVPDTVSFPELVQRCFILSNQLAGEKLRLLELRYTSGPLPPSMQAYVYCNWILYSEDCSLPYVVHHLIT